MDGLAFALSKNSQLKSLLMAYSNSIDDEGAFQISEVLYCLYYNIYLNLGIEVE